MEYVSYKHNSGQRNNSKICKKGCGAGAVVVVGLTILIAGYFFNSNMDSKLSGLEDV